MKRALITGISGQDGSYLAELLLAKDYEVHGLIRRSSNVPYNLTQISNDVTYHYGDMCTDNHLCYLIDEIKPHEVYNLAGQSDVGISFKIPEYTADVNHLGVGRLLEAIKHFSPRTRFYQASTSELFGNTIPPQNELTPMMPQSPYAIAKLAAYHTTRIYRQMGIHASNGIMFNLKRLSRYAPRRNWKKPFPKKN